MTNQNQNGFQNTQNHEHFEKNFEPAQEPSLGQRFLAGNSAQNAAFMPIYHQQNYSEADSNFNYMQAQASAPTNYNSISEPTSASISMPILAPNPAYLIATSSLPRASSESAGDSIMQAIAHQTNIPLKSFFSQSGMFLCLNKRSPKHMF